MNVRPAHPLEESTRKIFGDRFASVLLHGLYDEREAAEGRVQVGACPRGVGSPKELLITPLGQGRWGRKPLVLAALFRLLVGRPEIDRRLDFSFKELLGELKWPNIPASFREVEDAIDFYYWCGYSAAERRAGGGRAAGGKHRLITRYDRQGEVAPQCDLFGHDVSKISFDPTLAGALRRGRILFAGVDFGRLAARPPAGSAPGPGAPRRQAPPAGQPGGRPPAGIPPLPPAAKPVVRIEVTPVSKREADHRPKALARAVGETVASIDTGAIASAILRALHRKAARHPLRHGTVLESWEAVAGRAHGEIDRLLGPEIRAAVKRVQRLAYKAALRQGYGVIHAEEPEAAYGARGPRPVWHSADHLFYSLMRAFEAIEFDGWKPRQGVRINRGWDLNNVGQATLQLVVAYWTEVEGKELGEVDSGRMSKWLWSFGLPSFSRVRTAARQKVAERRQAETFMRAGVENALLFLAVWQPAEELE